MSSPSSHIFPETLVAMALPSPATGPGAPCAVPENSRRPCSAWGSEEHGARRCRSWIGWRGRRCKRPLAMFGGTLAGQLWHFAMETPWTSLDFWLLRGKIKSRWPIFNSGLLVYRRVAGVSSAIDLTRISYGSEVGWSSNSLVTGAS